MPNQRSYSSLGEGPAVAGFVDFRPRKKFNILFNKRIMGFYCKDNDHNPSNVDLHPGYLRFSYGSNIKKIFNM